MSSEAFGGGDVVVASAAGLRYGAPVTAATAIRQLGLPLPEAPASFDPVDLIEDAANAEARAWLDRPEDWPFGRLALWGGAKVGKTQLLRHAAAR
ncbi:MAG: hypothetical protein K2X74_08265, partial [Acetobacteraceae bacterium]|nr:hypothetical protein [Acetobacteraceae bacterium]